MFPFRPSHAAAALLELADAMLAPLPPSTAHSGAPDGQDATGAAPCAASHPHRQAVAIERRRRPATPVRPQLCLMPLTRAARTGVSSTPFRTTDAAR